MSLITITIPVPPDFEEEAMSIVHRAVAVMEEAFADTPAKGA